MSEFDVGVADIGEALAVAAGAIFACRFDPAAEALAAAVMSESPPFPVAETFVSDNLVGMTRSTRSTRPAAAAPANTAVAYLRVSTTEQADSGLGLEAQREHITAECARRGWTVVQWCVDAGASGSSTDGRPELERALALVRDRQAEHLVVAKLDRLSRSIQDFAGIMADASKRGWNLVALDLGVDLSTHTGQLVANIMASVAQWERGVIGQRTKDALAAKRAAGVRLGRRSTLTPEALAAVAELRGRGVSLAMTAATLNDNGVPTATGSGRWYPATVRAVEATDAYQEYVTAPAA